jgi:hypothetical protein
MATWSVRVSSYSSSVSNRPKHLGADGDVREHQSEMRGPTPVMNNPNPTLTHEAISNRARDIWHASGAKDGQDLANWLQAESELLSDASPDVEHLSSLDTGGGTYSERSTTAQFGKKETGSPLNEKTGKNKRRP